MTESNDITQKSAMGIIVIIIALILLILFGVFLVLNLRHWKTQTYKIRVIQRQAALRSKMKKKKLSESEQEKEVNSTEFKHFVLNEMIKIVIRMNSLRFRTVYWITCDKYYHIAIWCYLEIAKLCSKCRKKNVTVQNNDKDAEHGQHFNLLKPMSRFYHFINLSGIVTMWLIVNLIIAVLVKFENSNESISVANFMIGVLISTIVGNILIMLITKLLHILYMKNIEDSFAQQEVDMKFSKDKLFNETQKSETSPMLLNEYIQETQQSKDNREISSRTSSQRPETARGLVGPMRPLSRSRKDTKVIPVEKSEEEKEDKKEIKLEYLGDIDLLQDESKKSNNFINTSIFMTIFGFMAFFSLFCCIYAYSEYSQSVILSSLLMMLVAALAEVLLLRPLSCFAMTLVIMVKRKVKSKEIMMREIEEVKEELDLNSSYFKDKSDEISKENQEEDHKDEKVEIIQFNPNPDVEESKETENKVQADIESQNKSATIDKLKQDAIIEKIAKRPEKKKPAESRSEAAKIARYNIQLLENIYKAYEPEQADHVVKIFRKGGIFNIVPIIEEENEDSIDTYNQEIIPFGVGTNCYSAAPDLESQTTETNRNFDTNKDPNGLNAKLSGKDLAYSSGKLGDIKEENSQLLDELIDEKFRRDYNRKASDETGFDFEEGKNKNTGRTKAQGENFEAKAFEAQQSDSDDGWKKENKYGDSTSFDEETPLGAITLNERKKRKKRRLKRKKNDDGVNAKIRQLEEIYDVKLNDDNVSKVNKSQLGGELTSRNTFRNTFRNKNTAIIKRETTVKLSESASPRNINDIKTPIISKMANTHENWIPKKNNIGIKKQNTLKSEVSQSVKKQIKGKDLSSYEKPSNAQLPSLVIASSNSNLFNDKKTNADAHRKEFIKHNNFLRTSLNAAAKIQMSSNPSAQSSKGFNNIKKSQKKENDKGRKITQNDLVLNASALKAEYGNKKKLLPKRRYSKSPAPFKLDSESPYAEYLPALYREYKPKEKKYTRQNSNVSMNDFIRKLDRAYSDVGSIRGSSRNGSRVGTIRRKNSDNKSLNRMSTLKSSSSVSSYNKQSTIRSRSNPTKIKNKKNKKSSQSNEDSFLKMANFIKNKVLQEKQNKS